MQHTSLSFQEESNDRIDKMPKDKIISKSNDSALFTKLKTESSSVQDSATTSDSKSSDGFPVNKFQVGSGDEADLLKDLAQMDPEQSKLDIKVIISWFFQLVS